MDLRILTLLVVCAVIVACKKPPWRHGDVEKGHRRTKLLKLLCKVRDNPKKCDHLLTDEKYGKSDRNHRQKGKSNKSDGRQKQLKDDENMRGIEDRDIARREHIADHFDDDVLNGMI